MRDIRTQPRTKNRETDWRRIDRFLRCLFDWKPPWRVEPKAAFWTDWFCFSLARRSATLIILRTTPHFSLSLSLFIHLLSLSPFAFSYHDIVFVSRYSLDIRRKSAARRLRFVTESSLSFDHTVRKDSDVSLAILSRTKINRFKYILFYIYI